MLALQFANNKQPSYAVLKSDPSYLGCSVYDFPDSIVPPRELGPDGITSQDQVQRAFNDV
jgi:hypothetical protein